MEKHHIIQICRALSEEGSADVLLLLLEYESKWFKPNENEPIRRTCCSGTPGHHPECRLDVMLNRVGLPGPDRLDARDILLKLKPSGGG
jgi:hypothetical protein